MALARTFLILWLVLALAGCELVANFDRSKIPSATPDAGKRTDAGQITDAGAQPDAASEEDGGLGMDAGTP